MNVKYVMNNFPSNPISTDTLMAAKTVMAVINILVMFARIIFAQAGSYQSTSKPTQNMNAINVRKCLPANKIWKLMLETKLKILVESVIKHFVTDQI